jgi:hypothetical protein
MAHTGGYFKRKFDILPAYHLISGPYYVAIKISMLLPKIGLYMTNFNFFLHQFGHCTKWCCLRVSHHRGDGRVISDPGMFGLSESVLLFETPPRSKCWIKPAR